MLAGTSSKIQQARTLRRVCEMGWEDDGMSGDYLTGRDISL
jgi:hypothetical protein